MPVFAPPGMPLLASYRFTASSGTSNVLNIPACEILDIRFNIVGYSGGGGIASLRFNGDTTIGNYSSSYSPLTSTTKTNTLGTFGGAKLGQNSVTVQRSGQVTIYNVSGTSHLWTCVSTTHAATSGAPVTSIGSGVWTSSGQITSVQLIVDTGGITMPAGTSLAIYGQNP